MASIVTVHSWRMKDQRTGRWRALRFKLSNDQAREWTEKEGVELEKLASSRNRACSGQCIPESSNLIWRLIPKTASRTALLAKSLAPAVPGRGCLLSARSLRH